MSDLKLFRITGPQAVEVHGTGLSEVRRETRHFRRPNQLCIDRGTWTRTYQRLPRRKIFEWTYVGSCPLL